jgi:hypothetical protein
MLEKDNSLQQRLCRRTASADRLLTAIEFRTCARFITACTLADSIVTHYKGRHAESADTINPVPGKSIRTKLALIAESDAVRNTFRAFRHCHFPAVQTIIRHHESVG